MKAPKERKRNGLKIISIIALAAAYVSLFAAFICAFFETNIAGSDYSVFQRWAHSFALLALCASASHFYFRKQHQDK